MKAMWRIVVMLALAALIGPSAGSAVAQGGKQSHWPRCVLILRHGEKTGDKADVNLSKKGRERADALYRLFERGEERREPFPKPDFVFAATSDKSSKRPVQTVTPLATRLKLPINDHFQSRPSGVAALRDEIFGHKKYAGKTILIAWRHGSIPELARALGVESAPTKWSDDAFDRVWQITYAADGQATFTNRPQQLLAGDAKK